MAVTRTQTHAVATFSCLGDHCPDTCCKGWGMQLTRETVDKYTNEAPELLNAVDSGEAEFIMKRDPVTDYCVKFDNGWCGIHRDYGADFLGDACHFYPRITRAFDDSILTSIALSCPEAARVMLYGEQPFALAPREEVRVPFAIRNYQQAGLAPEQALAVHQRFVEEGGNPAFHAERNLMRIYAVARALEAQPPAQWEAAAHFYFTIAEGRLPQPEADANDLIHLAHSLMGLILASKATHREGLMGIAHSMQDALGMQIDPTNHTLALTPDARARAVQLLHYWNNKAAPALQPVLARYLQAQLSQAMFPFAGLGTTLHERITIIAVRFSTVRLALMAASFQKGEALDETEVVTTIYTLARFLDHLADPALSLAIYQETGWMREARLRALVGDS